MKKTTLKKWIGIDVGAKRKGFHLAMIDQRRLLACEENLSVADVAEFLAQQIGVQGIGIDAPCEWPAAGETSRADERVFAAAKICGIIYTPREEIALAHPSGYYDWILHGLELYAALGKVKIPTFEVFPTAAWTQLTGPKGNRSRAAWTTKGFESIPLQNLPARHNQDVRDAVMAAYTARLHSQKKTRSFGKIVVPKNLA